MTEYLKPSFSVQMGGTQAYRDNHDAIFGKKSEVYTPHCSICENTKVTVGVDLAYPGADQTTVGVVLGGPQTLKEQVTEFHKLYGQPINDKPTAPTTERLKLRLKLIAEEFVELLEASVDTSMMHGESIRDTDCYIAKALEEHIDRAHHEHYSDGKRIDGPNLVEVADALGDLMYVIQGMALECGIDLDAVLAEIHRSNLSKLGPKGEVLKNKDGKVMKSSNFVEPNIRKVLGL